MFTCFDACMLLCLHALTITFPYACIPPRSYIWIWMLWWSYAHMPLCSHILTCLPADMSTCFNDSMLPCSHALIPTCLNAHMLTCPNDHMLPCSHALMFTYSYAYMLWWSHAYMLWWSHAPMVTCIDIHMFNIHTHVHLDDYMSICLEAKVIVQLDVCALKFFDDYTWMMRWLGGKRYVYSHA